MVPLSLDGSTAIVAQELQWIMGLTLCSTRRLQGNSINCSTTGKILFQINWWSTKTKQEEEIKKIISNYEVILNPKNELADLIQIKPEIVYDVWDALKGITVLDFESEGRIYGVGLKKKEA